MKTTLRHITYNLRAARSHFIAVLAILLAASTTVTSAADSTPEETGEPNSIDLSPFYEEDEVTLLDLMDVEVVSVARHSQTISEAPAAISVLTAADLKRFGVHSLPEAFRHIPGMEVGQIHTHSWAVSSRGFNDAFANKLLVLIDGRSVYTPLFSGVYWELQDMVFEDIDQIEVIRGPGASLWGANAVNGVINIITKPTSETLGSLITIGGGTEELAYGAFRYGGILNEDATFRVYGKSTYKDESRAIGSSIGNSDDAQMNRGGFRIDWSPSQQNQVTFQGDIYAGRLRNSFAVASLTTPPTDRRIDSTLVSGGNLLARWTHDISEDSNLVLQAYYDRIHRELFFLEEELDVFDLDLQHGFKLGEKHNITYGGALRYTSDTIASSFSRSFAPTSLDTENYSAFIQDEIELVEDQLGLTLGTKLSENYFSGFEYQPTARLRWNPAENHMLWAGVSRAVRTPSRADAGLTFRQNVPVAGPPGLSVFQEGQSGLSTVSENLISYEIGYRTQLSQNLSVDLSAYYNDYDDLRNTQTLGAPSLAALNGIPYLRVPTTFDNAQTGEAYGVELSTGLQLTPEIVINANYSFLQLQLHSPPTGTEGFSEASEGRSPHHQASIRASFQLPRNWEFSTWARYVGDLPSLNVPSYVSLNAQFAWRPRPSIELAIGGKNLSDDQHLEFEPVFTQFQTGEIQRSLYATLTYRF
jgi:iron complex outermembrane receptor protein